MTSLYERIGGEGAVDLAVKIFYRKVLADPSINHFFENTDMPRQEKHQKAFLTYAFGGPNNYSGKGMRAAHKRLALKEEHFAAVAGHLKATLQELKVPDDLQAEVMVIAASTHDDVLNI
ncbi:MAG: group 1 truncated hemoglobin [Alphaproteobacteria bacterium CG11_big_fil_rev_8_21_14_0_20_44_7]|nr:MAG: group 1 truncated hemoglobin [Alphaproteobacteria bacterium CG11_big_fil_rev_8_21_14_0_20_44_7]